MTTRPFASGRRAFTMPELLIFLAVAAIPLGVTWCALVSGSRQSAAAGARINAVQVCQIAFETIRDDLLQIASLDPSCATSSAASGEGTTSAADPGEFTFLRFKNYGFKASELYKTADGPPAWLTAEQVTYRFNHERHQLERNGRPLANALFLDGHLRLEGGQVAVRLVLVPEELLAQHLRGSIEESDIPVSARTVLSFKVSLPQVIAQSVHSSWVENPFDRPPSGTD